MNFIVPCRELVTLIACHMTQSTPIILNGGHRLTEFSVWDIHNNIKYLVERQTLAEICSCYWILRVKSFVKKILHRCLICRKFNSRSYSHPNSPNVPNIRVNDDTTFFLDQSWLSWPVILQKYLWCGYIVI